MRALVRRAGLALVAALAFAPQLAAQATLTESDYLALGRKYYEWFANGQADSVNAHMAADARESVGGVEGVKARIDEFDARAGLEVEFVEEKMTRRRGNPQYWREARYTGFTEEPIVFRWVFNGQGEITGIGLTPKSRAPAPD
ncbi:MAG: hypothetical protein OEW17_09995 [Gemmatimonadota bacterium]|nr:hypothetical protein [Gemmatimonadota bacterium]